MSGENKMKKNKRNPYGWDSLLGGDWKVSPPKNTDGEYVKEKRQIYLCIILTFIM